MKDDNQNIQKSVLFDDSIPCIDTSSNDLNIVHKKSATPDIAQMAITVLNNTKITIKNLIINKKPQSRNIMMSLM